MGSVTQTSGSQSETQFESNENSYYIEFYMEFSLWDGPWGYQQQTLPLAGSCQPIRNYVRILLVADSDFNSHNNNAIPWCYSWQQTRRSIRNYMDTSYM